MSDYAQNFIAYLQGLKDHTGALAHLRHSLRFDPGCYIPAFPYVERFVAADKHPQDSSRRALYLVAGLFALHPKQGNKSLAAAFGALMWERKRRQRGSASIEQRFIALLGANAQNLPNYLRQTVTLLRADERALDYAALLDDASRWLNPRIDPQRRDEIRRDWARDFYRVMAEAPSSTNTVSESTSTSV